MSNHRSTTFWSRLEPRTRDVDMFDGLRAGVHDPLWLLGRQWQTGELAGEDGGSLVDASIDLDVDRIARFRPGTAEGPDDDTVYDPTGPTPPPLETLVEADRVRPAAAGEDGRNYRDAAEAGSHFLRLLAADFGFEADDFPTALRLDDAPTDDEGRRYATIVRGRALDGDAVYAAYDYETWDGFAEAVALGHVANDLPGDLDADDESGLADFWEAVAAYREWYREHYDEPAASEASWNDERLEYGFAVSTGQADRETVFSADGYEGGRLDWYDFDVDDGGSLEPDDDEDRALADDETEERVPTPSRFKGMPAYRWWEFEDDGVDFSAVEAAPEDLSRLLLLEYGLVYGNEWFTVPIELEVGSLAGVTDLTLTTSFNETIEVEEATDLDDDATTDWSVYTFPLSGDDRDRGLFLPPVLGSVLESDSVAEIEFGRDELANVGWGIERAVEGSVGQRRDRRTETALDETAATPVATSDEAETAYQLASPVRDNWFPLLPRRSSLSSVVLDRGVAFTPDGDPSEPLSDLLEGEFSLPEEEVPRTGKTVETSYAYTRWTDGDSHLWRGREVGIGRGRADSGVRFDLLVDPRVGEQQSAVDEPTNWFPGATPVSTSGQIAVVGVDPETPGGPRENLEDEYVLLENASDHWLDLASWTVTDDNGHVYEFPSPTLLAPAQRVAVRTGQGEDTETTDWYARDQQRHWGRDQQVWNDDGDVVSVFDATGDRIVTYAYPERPQDIQTGALALADVQPDPPGIDTENLDEEYVAFENEGDNALDLAGWTVSDAAGHRYVFPDGTILDADETVTLRTGTGTDADGDVYWGYGRPIWNNEGDTVAVFEADESLVLRKSY